MTPAATHPVDAPHEHRPADGPRRALTSLGTLGAAILVLVAALSGVGGTYAMWSAQQTTDAGTLTAGTAELEASWRGEVSASDNLLPGQSVTREAQLRNTGDVPLALSIAGAAGISGIEMRAAATCDAAERTTAIGAATAPLVSGAPGGGSVVVHPGESVSACISVTATPALAPGTRIAYTLDIEGTQVR